MNFDHTDDQAQIKSLVERFAADRYDAERRRRYLANDTGFAAENWQLMHALGLLALPFSEADGGFAAGPVEIALVSETFGRALVVEPFISDLLLGGGLLARSPDAALKAAWLPRILQGGARVVLAHAEHATRFGTDGVRCSAHPAGDHWRLGGDKTFVQAAVGADAFLVSAKTGAATGVFLVEAGAAGLSIAPYRLVDGSVAAEMHLQDVVGTRVADLAEQDVIAVQDRARHAVCGEMVGVMSLLFDATLQYVKMRRQFGQPIGSFQAIQHRLADLYAELELSRSHLLRATLSSAPDDVRAIAEAKAYISACALHMGEECVQMHGAMGTSDELLIGHGYKRLLLLSVMFGDGDTEIGRIAAIAR